MEQTCSRRNCLIANFVVRARTKGRPAILKKLYDWTISKARHPQAERWLAFISFIESSVFPIPPDIVLAPMALAERQKAFRFAAICTVASVLGGMLGYAIGYFLWDVAGAPIIEFYGYQEQMAKFQTWYDEWGLLIVFAAGLTPLPYKVFTIASGVAALNPLLFIGGSIASRGIRFFAEAALFWKFGDPIQRFVEERLPLLMTIMVILVVGGFVALKYI